MSSREESVEQAQQPTLCVKCNTFYSNAACNDLCSKCFNSAREQEAKTAAACTAVGAAAVEVLRGRVPTTSSSQPATCQAPALPAAAEASTSSAPADSPDGSEKKSGPSRCSECRKKVGLCGFKCKCGQLFCGQHRYAESHNCAFDYKTSERAKLSEANPVVQAAKVQKL